MSAEIQVVVLVLAVLAAASFVSLPILRPPANAEEHPVLAGREEGRARLVAALEELGRDLKSGMISHADYSTAVGAIRRRLSRL